VKRQHSPSQVLEAVIRHGGSRVKAAEELKITTRCLQNNLKICEARGDVVPPSPYNTDRANYLVEQAEAAHKAAPDGFNVKGVSTLYDADGKISAQWVKTNQTDEARLDALREAVAALSQEVTPQAPIKAPEGYSDRLCNLYTITDYHIGMLAWHREGGADWDLQIAERVLTSCFSQMIHNSPPAKYAVVNQLGDFLHTDAFSPTTPTSHHVLDADSRFPKIVQVAVRSLRNIVNQALTKHECVHVIMAEGNHDPSSSVWLREMFSALYEDEPRVTVETTPLPYYAYQHGKTMLAFHHGHLKKKEGLPGLIAAQFPQMWGATTKRYAHVGHMHHTHELEHPGITVTQHPTLAARDAYAARGGWYSERSAQAITYHSEYGQVGRVMVTPEMVV
jgi:hypothetical protein